MPQTPEQVASKIKQIKGESNKRWGRLSDEERLKIAQKRTILVGKIQKRYGHRDRQDPPAEDQ